MVIDHISASEDLGMTSESGPGVTGARSAEQGFTLIELMISVLLLAVLLGIGIPSFRSLVADQRLRAVSTDLRLALNMTRSEAVKRNRSVVLAPGADGWDGGWTIANPDPNDPDILNYAQREGVTIAGPASVAFNSFGRTNGTPEFEIGVNAVSGATMCLQMQLDGRAVASKGNCP